MTGRADAAPHGTGPMYQAARALVANPGGLTLAQLREVTGLDGHTLTRDLNIGRYSGRFTKTMTRLSLAQAGGQYGREWGYVWKATEQALKPCGCWGCTRRRDPETVREHQKRERQKLEIRRRARRAAV